MTEPAGQATAVLHLVFLVAMAGILTLGIAGIVVLWFTRGRDPAIGEVAEYITTPPDDLPPGAAGTLLDERAERKDVVATLLGLGRHGAIAIDSIEEDRGGRRFRLTLLNPAKAGSRLERDLVQVMFQTSQPEFGMSVDLRDVQPRFETHVGQIRVDLYQEMVDRKYFVRSPEITRRRWQWRAGIGLALVVVIGLILAVRVDAWALFPMIAGIALFAGMFRMSAAMPRKTLHGAESAARWRAFRRYLASLDQRADHDVSTARERFDEYLSYAVAFGIDTAFIEAFARVGASRPEWFGPGTDANESVFETIRLGQVIGHFGDSGVQLPNIPNVVMPDVPNISDSLDLQLVADSTGSSLQGASEGLGELLNAAGGIFEGIDFDIDL